MQQVSCSKEDKVLTTLCLCLLLVQVILVFYYNLTDLTRSLDADAAGAIYHADRIIQEGTVHLSDWKLTTSLELDSSIFFAIPLTFLTHDIFRSVGLANLIWIIIYLLVIERLTANCGMKLMYRLLAMTAVIITYSFGMLEYFNMLFYSASQYTVRVLVPLVMILTLQYGRKLSEAAVPCSDRLSQGTPPGSDQAPVSPNPLTDSAAGAPAPFYDFHGNLYDDLRHCSHHAWIVLSLV